MKTKSDMKPIIIATLSLILLAGCGNDDFPVEEQKVPLEIASAFVTGDVQTRAVTPQLLTSGSIGVFLEGESGTSYVKKIIYSMTITPAGNPTRKQFIWVERMPMCVLIRKQRN